MHLNISNEFLLESESFPHGGLVQSQKSKATEMREETDAGETRFMKVLRGLVLGLLSFIVLPPQTAVVLGLP